VRAGLGVSWVGEFDALQADQAVLRNNCIMVRFGMVTAAELHDFFEMNNVSQPETT